MRMVCGFALLTVAIVCAAGAAQRWRQPLPTYPADAFHEGVFTAPPALTAVMALPFAVLYLLF